MNKEKTIDITLPLGKAVSIRKRTINPSAFPLEEFDYYSIPSYDISAGAERTFGDEIKSNKTLLESNCVLISKLNPRIPRVCLAIINDDKRAICSTEFIPLVLSDDKTDLKYLSYYLLSSEFQQRFRGVAAGSTNSHSRVTPGDILDWDFYRPPLQEQKRIAEILSQAKNLIHKLEKKRDKVKNLLLATRDNIFQRYLKSGDLCWVSVDDLLKTKDLLLIQDGNHGEKHPKSNQFTSNGTPFVRASNIKDGCLIPDQKKCLSFSIIGGLRIGHSLPGDVLLTNKATIGEICIVPKTYKQVMLSPQVTMYRLSDHSFLTAELLKQFFLTSTFQNEIREMSGQSTRDYIGVKAQRNLHILLPKSKSIASKITEPLWSVSQLHLSITNQINLYKNLFSAMSRDLLAGRKRGRI